MNDTLNNLFKNDTTENETPFNTAFRMFSTADKNGVLFIPEFGDGISNDDNAFLKIRLEWSEKDVYAVIKECENALSGLKKILEMFGAKFVAEIQKEEVAAVLHAETVAVFENYLEKGYRTTEDKKLFFVLFYAQRIFRLLQIGAPQIVLSNEVSLFTQAVIVNKYAISVEYVKL